MVTADRSRVAEIPHLIFCKTIVAHISRVADISENMVLQTNGYYTIK